MLITSTWNDPSQSHPLLLNTSTFRELQDKRTPAADVLWAFCTLQHSMLIENNRKTFPFGSGPSLQAALNGQKISGLSISVVYAPTRQWPPQPPPPMQVSGDALLPISLYNKFSLPARKQKISLETAQQTSSLQPPGWDKPPRNAPLTSLCTADKEQKHMDAFESTQVPLFPAARSTEPLSAEGTRTPQVHSIPRKLLCTHQVYLCNPAEIWLELAEAPSFRVLGPCLFLVFAKIFLRKLPPRRDSPA